MDKAILARLIASCPWQEYAPNPKHPGKISFMTGPVRLTFARLHEPKTKENGKPSFSACFIVPVDADLTMLSNIVNRVAVPMHGPNYATNPKFNLPYKKQADMAGQLEADGKPKYQGFGTLGVFLSAESKFKVPVHPAVPGVLMNTERGQGVYSGMWCRAHLRAYAYGPTKDKPTIKAGVGFGLIEIQKLCDDEEFKNANAGSKFGAVDGIEMHNPMGGTAQMPGASLPGM